MKKVSSAQKIYFIAFFVFYNFVTSCSYKQKNILFKTPKEIHSEQPIFILNANETDSSNYRHRIKPNDRLLIRFLNNYDIGQAASLSATAAGNSQLVSGEDKGYLVNYDSSCTLPMLGRINLVGLTRLEAAKKLEELYSKYIINPIIDVNIASLSVTVLGEVYLPGKIRVDKENTTIVDIIALAGGLKDTSKKRNIKIIRGSEIITVDLTNIESIKNQLIIIHDNDIIYIEPIGTKVFSDPFASLLPLSTVLLTITQLIVISLQIYTLTKK